MSRWKAAGIHLCISLLIVGTFVGFLFVFWFRQGLFHIAGMDRLLLTMLGVDIAIGPLLTCIVYKRGKPSLKFDLTAIAVLQAAFLAYALHSSWVSRPVFLVWSIDQLNLVFANEVSRTDLAQGTTPETRSLSWFGPKLVAAELPDDPRARQKAFATIEEGKASLERSPVFYVPYAKQRQKILAYARPLTSIDMDARTLESSLPSGFSATDLRGVLVESSRGASIMLIDAKNAAPIRVLPSATFKH